MPILDWTRPETWSGPISRIAADHQITSDQPFGIVEHLRAEFSALRAAHGCKPTEFASYQSVGLEPFRSKAGIAEASELFGPLVSPEAVGVAIREAMPEASAGRTYLAVDHRQLVGDGSHYLFYGGEFLQRVAHRLQETTGAECLQVLKERGTPTILQCVVPLEMIDDVTLDALGFDLLQWLEVAEAPPTHVLDFTVGLSAALPAYYIVGCIHPQQDPVLVCPWCAVEEPSC